MEIKFDDEMIAVINYSREEALRTGNSQIGPDHLLLGILRHELNSACSIMQDLGVNLSQLKRLIDEKIGKSEQIPFSRINDIVLSRTSQNILSISAIEAALCRSSGIGAIHVLLALCKVEVGFGCEFLGNLWGVHYENVKPLAEKTEPASEPSSESGPSSCPDKEETASAEMEEKSVLVEFGRDLTAEAGRHELDPVHGRDKEIERVILILGRRKKNSAVLVGEPGVGKSAIVDGIATRIANHQVPENLENKKIISVDIASIVAGTRFRGDFEKRLKAVINEVSQRDDIILFFDEMHTIVGAGKAEGSLDAANILKPALARGEIQCIGTTTVEEFTRFIEKDGALDRRFQKVTVEETDPEDTMAILRLIAPKYEQHHKVKYSEDALLACVNLSRRYIFTRHLPDKAIDVLDEAGSMVHLTRTAGKKNSVVDADDIAKVISKMTGIPSGRIARSESERLLNMSKELSSEVVGQQEAIDKISRAICRSRAGLKNPDRPIGCFLFCGPTGVGKTLLAKCLAEYLFDSKENMVRLDMSEYMEKYSVSRLIGAAPGYVGFEDNGQLTEPVRHKPYCVVLLDEIEKAHPDIFNILLQVMDDGQLTDSHGRKVSFRNTILIMTSNAGSKEVARRGNGVGFDTGDSVDFRQVLTEQEINHTFPPEFLGRLDDKIHFNSLGIKEIEAIVNLEIKKFKSRVEENGYKLSVSAATKKRIVKEGFNPRFGARPLRKALMEIIEDPVSEQLIKKRLSKHSEEDCVITV